VHERVIGIGRVGNGDGGHEYSPVYPVFIAGFIPGGFIPAFAG
jgi:hypothetical protein